MLIISLLSLLVAPFTRCVGYNGQYLHDTNNAVVTDINGNQVEYHTTLVSNQGNNPYYATGVTNQFVSYVWLQNPQNTSEKINVSIKFGLDSSYEWYSWSVMIDKQSGSFQSNMVADISITYNDKTSIFPTCYFYDKTLYLYSKSYTESYTPATPCTITISCRLLPEDLVNHLGDYDTGYAEGYQEGYSDGEDIGKQIGNSDGYDEGYQNGHADGYLEGTNSGESYRNGYNNGYQNGLSHSTADFGFMNLFTGIADTPIMMMRSLFGFDIFGMSVLTVVLSLFTALIVLKLMKKVIK